jgi:CTP synthase
MVFLEALRQFQFRVGLDNIVFVHVSLVPGTDMRAQIFALLIMLVAVVGAVGEQKTKPTQHSVKELRR